MRKEEEKRLLEAKKLLEENGKKNPAFRGFFASLSSFPLPSLQEASLEDDFSFIAETSKILSVIETIAHSPHVVSKNVETLMRADQAGSLSTDSFQKTLRDPALWKRKGGEMSPEYVHHKESVDEIRIYENLFVMLVLSRIEAELHHRRAFFQNRIRSTNSPRFSLDSDRTLEALEALKPVFAKLGRIRKSNFVWELSKGPLTIEDVHPTNILKSDPLYNRVYRYYLSFSRYSKGESQEEDITTYYYCLFLRLLAKSGFKASPKSYRVPVSGKGCFLYGEKEIRLISADFLLTLCRKGPSALSLSLTPLSGSTQKGSWLLLFNPADSLEGFSLGRYVEEISHYDGIYAFSLWDCAELRRGEMKVLSHQEDGEEALLHLFWSTKTDLSKASERVYSLYCPVCLEKAPLKKDVSFYCPHCHSRYAFVDTPSGKKLWIIEKKKKEED